MLALLALQASALTWSGGRSTLLRCSESALPDRFSVLSRRVASVAAEEDIVQCILLDCMVPRQRYEFRLPPQVGAAVKTVREDGQILCVLGMQHKMDSRGQPVFGGILRRGVEARIESLLPLPMANGAFSAHATPMGGWSWRRRTARDDGV